jgi:hypothetical protein
VADNDINLESHGLDTSIAEPTCCFLHFITLLRSAEDEEISSSSHLPQVQAHVQQPAIDESRTEKDRSEDSHPTTDLGRKRVTSEYEASEGDIYTMAQPLQKRAKTVGEVRAELPTAANTAGCLQEHQTPHVEPSTGSPSVFRGMF